jgi:hypothetical protein
MPYLLAVGSGILSWLMGVGIVAALLLGAMLLLSGERIGGQSDETPQRAFYRHWREVMTRNGGGA